MLTIYTIVLLLSNTISRITVSSNQLSSKWSAAINFALDSYHISTELVIIVTSVENHTESEIKTTVSPSANEYSLANLPTNDTVGSKFHVKILKDSGDVNVEKMIVDFHDMTGSIMLLRVNPLSDQGIVEDTHRRSSGRSTAPVIFLLLHEERPLKVLQIAMAMLSLLELWSPRAPHIVALRDVHVESEETIVQVLGELWRHKVSRVAVLQQGPQGFILRWWAPQGHGKDCEGPSTEGLVAMELSHKAGCKALPQRRSYNYYSGCTLLCSTFEWLPYAIKGEGGRIVGGLDLRILETIRLLMNFTAIYSLAHETYSEASDAVSNGSSHFALGGFILMEEYYPANDVTVAYWHDNAEWYVPVGLPIPRWLSVARVFSGALWSCVVLSCILVAVAFSILPLYQGARYKGPRAVDAIRMLLGIYAQEPGTVIGSWIFAVWLLSSLIINFAYQSGLIGFLANPGVFPSLSTIEELAEKKMKILTHYEYKIVLEGFDDPIYKTLMSNTVPCEDMIACMGQVASSQDYVMPADLGYISYGFEGEGRRKVKAIAHLAFYSIHMYVEKGSPLLEWFDFYISSIVESNLNRKWYNEIIGSRGPLGPQRNSRTNSNPVQMNVEHLQGAFFILLAGLIVSFVVFLREMFFVRLWRKCFSWRIRRLFGRFSLSK